MNGWFGEEKGTIMILFALLIVFIIALVGLSADVGLVYHHRALLQNAADAAALAGASQLPNTAIAAFWAEQYGKMNGINSPDTLAVSFPTTNRIQVDITRNVRLNFAPLLGLQTITVAARAKAQAIQGGTAFNYAVFSGSQNSALIMNGSGQFIQGDGHSNQNTIMNGSNLTITGRMDQVGTFRANGSKINVGSVVEHWQYIPMPDFSSQIASTAATIYNSNQVFNGSKINVNGSMYVNGSITFNGAKIQGVGCALATGNVVFNGSGLSYDSAGAAVCIYSKNGDITINGSGITVYGILYAPNGSIIMNGSNQTIHGAVIGKTVTFNGSNNQIIYDANATTSLPNTDVQLVE